MIMIIDNFLEKIVITVTDELSHCGGVSTVKTTPHTATNKCFHPLTTCIVASRGWLFCRWLEGDHHSCHCFVMSHSMDWLSTSAYNVTDMLTGWHVITRWHRWKRYDANHFSRQWLVLKFFSLVNMMLWLTINTCCSFFQQATKTYATDNENLSTATINSQHHLYMNVVVIRPTSITCYIKSNTVNTVMIVYCSSWLH